MPKAASACRYKPILAAVGSGPNQLIVWTTNRTNIRINAGPIGPLVLRKYQTKAPTVMNNSSAMAASG